MKKLAIYLGIIVVLFGALFALNAASQDKSAGNFYKKPKSELHPETVKLLDDPLYQNNISPDELAEKIRNKETVFVYFYQSNCPYCKETTPMLMQLSQQLGIDLKQFNLLEFREGWQTYKIEATPTLVVYKDGKEVERLVGGYNEDPQKGHTKDEFEHLLKKYKA